jgi:hypothetical protein
MAETPGDGQPDRSRVSFDHMETHTVQAALSSGRFHSKSDQLMTERAVPEFADRNQWVILAARRAIVRCDDGQLYTLIGIPKGKGHRARLASQDETTARTVRLGFITSIEHIPTTQGETQ